MTARLNTWFRQMPADLRRALNMPKMGSGSRPTPPPKPSIPPAAGAAAVPVVPQVAQAPPQNGLVAQPPVNSGDHWDMLASSLKEMSSSLRLMNNRLATSASSCQDSGEASSAGESVEEPTQDSSSDSPMETSPGDSLPFPCDQDLIDLEAMLDSPEMAFPESTDL